MTIRVPGIRGGSPNGAGGPHEGARHGSTRIIRRWRGRCPGVFGVLLACLAALPTAVAGQAGDVRTIRVTGSAAVERAPDRAVVRTAVMTRAATAEEATDGNAALMEDVRAALRAAGLGPDVVRTVRFSVDPVYLRGPPQQEEPPEISGYAVTNEIEVEVADVAAVGSVIDTLVGAGANRISGVRFELRDPESAELEAVGLAVERARREAEAIAAALGAPLGRVVSVTSGGGSPDGPRAFRAEMAAATPIEPGPLSVTARVEVVYEIGG